MEAFMEEKGLDTLERIQQAAMEEFGTHNYSDVTIDNICSRHGISKGMMYHYYSNKDELFLLCVERTFQELRAMWNGIWPICQGRIRQPQSKISS